ncbi:aldo-keto reductase family 1 member C1 homolog isoform X5 [Pteropus medius]|uniref:aldo-keto reductase family 1 member C1 homolog isoform X5 n=1 Tax=Pteropus vampyrus TaxID=132908 RepID=UPI00196BA2C3|nr:aldo-keto reductase family 1 member C1 homolog isoform X5 [Pteropus giganteus]
MSLGRHLSMKLNDGHFMPVLGFGTSAATKVANRNVEEATERAISAGYRHIDSAYVYQNEEEVGRALQKKMADGTVTRNDLFFTTKLWSTCLRPEFVQTNLERSLKKLQLSYVDLYLIHFPVALKFGEEKLPKDTQGRVIFDRVDLCATWEPPGSPHPTRDPSQLPPPQAMENCKEAGLTRSIGVSNFNRRQLELIINKPGLQYKPVCNQDPVIKAIADKHGRTPAQVALRYQLQRGLVVLAKSFNEKRMRENLQVFDFQLTAEDMETLDGLDRNIRYLQETEVCFPPRLASMSYRCPL